MRSAILPLLLACASRAFGDPITVTILSQTTFPTAVTSGTGYQSFDQCREIGVLDAVCSTSEAGFGPGDTIYQLATATIGGAYRYPAGNLYVGSLLSVDVRATGVSGGGQASATLTDQVLITGGTGTGYLNVDFSIASIGPQGALPDSMTMTVNGQNGSIFSAGFLWGVFPFRFGQPFSYTVWLLSAADNTDGENALSITPIGAQIYTDQPGSCVPPTATEYPGLCSDPGAVNTDALFTIQSVPEPNTFGLAIAFLAIGGIVRRFVH